MNYFISVVIPYIIGAIPAGFIVSKLFYKTDITKKGSGNIGFANIAQFLGIKAAVIVFLLDFVEGFVAVFIIKALYNSNILSAIAAFSVVFGHDFSIFMGFKGGKGASTTYGALAFLSPLPTLFGAFTFFAVLAWKKYISLSNMVSIATIPIYMILLHNNIYFIYSSLLLSVLLLYTHRNNIKDLINGKEISILNSNPIKNRKH
jgi:glycerol-3-phosphate acyltransferase PlsY